MYNRRLSLWAVNDNDATNAAFYPEISNLRVGGGRSPGQAVTLIINNFDAQPTNLATLITAIVTGPLSVSVESDAKGAGTHSHYHDINLDHALEGGGADRMELRRYSSQLDAMDFYNQCDAIADLVVESRKYERECLNVEFQIPQAGGGYPPDTLDYASKSGLAPRPAVNFGLL